MTDGVIIVFTKYLILVPQLQRIRYKVTKYIILLDIFFVFLFPNV